ncbi:MAG TPA: carboxypeptidase-like regulatory domain-containing protein, partial [Membranihabitans sp.]|nr:carboxypeptidase-like regulatory domain-containing protein [Membranihabitans sp.]
MKYPVILGIFLLMAGQLSGQVISGRVQDSLSSEPLVNAHIWDLENKNGTSTDEFGRFHITIEENTSMLIVSYVGYLSDTITMEEMEGNEWDVRLRPAAIDEVTISSHRLSPGEQFGRYQIPIQQLNSINFIMGEQDLLRSLAGLPGISLGDIASNGLMVRGGKAGQNLILLDGAPVYNTNHLLGMFSTFNSSIVKNVDFYKGGLPARFGGRLSSVIDVSTREGNREEFKSDLKVGLINSGYNIEGPLGKSASFIGTFRASYLGLVVLPLKFLYNAGNIDTYVNYWMYDGNLKVNWRLSDRDEFYASFYKSQDVTAIYSSKFDAQEDSGTRNRMTWGNNILSMRYNRRWSDRLFSKLQLYSSGNSNQQSTLSDEFEDGTQISSVDFLERSSVWEMGLVQQNDWLLGSIGRMRLGFEVNRNSLKPNVLDIIGFSGPDKLDLHGVRINSKYTQFSAYLNPDLHFGSWLHIEPGLRYSRYITNGKSYTNWEPRLKANANTSGNSSLSFSYDRNFQFLHQLTHYANGIPASFWVVANDRVAPQKVHQWAVGFGRSFDNGNYLASVEGYYKTMSDLIDFREGTPFFGQLDQTWTDLVETDGIGKAYGAEFFVHKKTGRWNGWAGYTLSWSRHRFENLNHGEWYYSRYDRRHDLEVYLNFRWNEKWSF